ncbi:hypothetical protein TNCV_466211 [Trichonephila clavipes]|nr:hypothetical protein TNCV_466211 [Trichonephila clavipes]
MIGRDRSSQKVGVEEDWVDPKINDPPGINLLPKSQPICLGFFYSSDVRGGGDRLREPVDASADCQSGKLWGVLSHG